MPKQKRKPRPSRPSPRPKRARSATTPVKAEPAPPIPEPQEPKVVPGFHVHGFWAALGGWLLMSFFTFAINVLIGESGRIEAVHVREIVRY